MIIKPICLLLLNEWEIIVYHTSYHNRMNSTYPCTGQHCVDQLWDHGKVDGHPVSLFHTLNIETTRFYVLDNINQILAIAQLKPAMAMFSMLNKPDPILYVWYVKRALGTPHRAAETCRNQVMILACVHVFLVLLKLWATQSNYKGFGHLYVLATNQYILM